MCDSAGNPHGVVARGVASTLGVELTGLGCTGFGVDLGGSAGFAFGGAVQVGEPATVGEGSDGSSLSSEECSVLTPSTGWDMPKALLPMLLRSTEREARV